MKKKELLKMRKLTATPAILSSAKQIEISSGTATDVHIIQFVRIM